MKTQKLIMLSFLILASCDIRTKPQFDVSDNQTEEKEIVPVVQLDSVEQSLVLRVYDDYNERTKVSYAGKAKKGNFYMAASYNINKNDILKNRLPEPKADDFTICVIASHKGAKDVSRVELTINGGLYTLRPNFKKYEGNGKFTMIFNIGRLLNNLSYPERISYAERVEARTVFDNGNETCELSKEDLKSVSVIYKSYIIDGGKFE